MNYAIPGQTATRCCSCYSYIPLMSSTQHHHRYWMVEVDRIWLRFRRRMWTNGHFRQTFGFGRKQPYNIRCTVGFGVLQLVNSVVAESRVQNLSCGGRECARRRESLASLCTDWLCKDNRGSWLRCLRLHLLLQLALLLSYVFDLLFRLDCVA